MKEIKRSKSNGMISGIGLQIIRITLEEMKFGTNPPAGPIFSKRRVV